MSNRYNSLTPNEPLADSNDATRLLNALDVMAGMLYQVHLKIFWDYYKNGVGGWHISYEELPDSIKDRLLVSVENSEYSVEIGRSFDGNHLPLVVDGSHGDEIGIGLISFNQRHVPSRQIASVRCVVHGRYDEQGNPVNSLTYKSDSTDVRTISAGNSTPEEVSDFLKGFEPDTLRQIAEQRSTKMFMDHQMGVGDVKQSDIGEIIDVMGLIVAREEPCR